MTLFELSLFERFLAVFAKIRKSRFTGKHFPQKIDCRRISACNLRKSRKKRDFRPNFRSFLKFFSHFFSFLKKSGRFFRPYGPRFLAIFVFFRDFCTKMCHFFAEKRRLGYSRAPKIAKNWARKALKWAVRARKKAASSSGKPRLAFSPARQISNAPPNALPFNKVITKLFSQLQNTIALKAMVCY